MSEQEQKAYLAYADLKRLIIGKFIRTIEYGFSGARVSNKKRSFVTDEKKNEEIKDSVYTMLNVIEAEIKDELKKMEI